MRNCWPAPRARPSRKLGLELFAPGSPGSSVTAVKAPAGMDSGVIVKEFRNRFGAIIANGQGSMKGQIFRIAHLGYFDFADLFAMVAEPRNHPARQRLSGGIWHGRRRRPERLRRSCGSATQERVQRMNGPGRGTAREAASSCSESQPGWNVIVSSPKEYANHLAEADALIVRSAVQVNQAVLDKAPKLRVIGRAGVGVDNVDLEAATAAGVLVMNTPGGNAISVAEHTLALMLAMARRIPEATAIHHRGKWEKKKFMGSELRGKSLGIVGLGSIGREVVKRARAFEMRVQAYDPYVTAQIAKDLGVELVDLAALYARERLHHAACGADARDRQACFRMTPSRR